MTAEAQVPDTAPRWMFTITDTEFLATFAEIMHEWGFASSGTPKCETVRLPTLTEARSVLARSRYTGN